MSYDLIKYYYEMGVYNIQKMIEQVKLEYITEEEFHMITGYSYKGLTMGK